MGHLSTLSIFLLSLFVLSLSTISNAQSPPRPKAFTFLITKDVLSNQYYVTIRMGAKSVRLNVVIDLGGEFLWFNSRNYFAAASTYRPIQCGSRQCKLVDDPGCVFCFQSPPVPGCTNNTCADYALNPFTGTQGYSGLGQDTLYLFFLSQAQYRINNFPFQYSDPVLREGLSNKTAGVIGLGKTKLSLPAQITSNFKIPQEFTLCIPSSKEFGLMILGKATYNDPFRKIVTSSLQITPLISNPVSTSGNEVIGDLSAEYFIDVRSIKVGGRALKLNKTLLAIDKRTGAGGTSIRTVRPYTTLHISIYRVLINEFVRVAKSMGIKRVESVAPFGACFDSKTISVGSKRGPRVPAIDFVLQSDDVVWRFFGSNSMVAVNNNVMCLAFVEGGINLTGPTSSIVVGGYQLENYLLQFDVVSLSLGFSYSLLLQGTSCSKLITSVA